MTAQDIKEFGYRLGYSKVGITSADGFPDYVEEVKSRGDEFDILAFTTTNPLVDAIPKAKMPDAKSIIVLVYDYGQYDYPDELTKMIGKAYLGRCYGPQPGNINYARLQLMKDYLADHGCKVDTSIGLPARWTAAQAGVTTFGRNNFAYADGCGSYIIISTIVIDKELEYDTPTMECKCPPNCRACMDACPMQAIYEPFHLNPRKCISFNNWMTQDGRPGISSYIPEEIREKIGCHVHGCDICQDVCPRNQEVRKRPKKMDPFIAEIAPDITLSNLLHMTDEFYQTRIHPIMYNYIKDKRYFQRNAAIAMGNLKDPAFIPELELELENPDAMIREAVEWALERIGWRKEHE